MYILYMYSKGAYEPKAQIAGAYFVFLLMKHAEEYCYSLLDRNLVHRRVTPPPPTPQQGVASTHLYTWMKRDKVE